MFWKSSKGNTPSKGLSESANFDFSQKDNSSGSSPNDK